MKKIISLLVTATMLLSMAVFTNAVHANETPISVLLNNEQIAFDQPPVIMNDRTMVPFRAIFEALGAEVNWNAEKRMVSAIRGEEVIELVIGYHYMNVNGSSVGIDSPPVIVGDRTLVPVRAISEALDCYVEWDGEARAVSIYEKPDYMKKYSDYIMANQDLFQHGIMLCDMNEDGVCELFSIEYVSFVYHNVEKGIAEVEKAVELSLSSDNIRKYASFYENPAEFMGIYRDKTTNEKVLISYSVGNQEGFFYMLRYRNGEMIFEDMSQYTFDFTEVDKILSNYQLTDEEIYMGIALHGGRFYQNADEMLVDYYYNYGNCKRITEYDEVKDGVFNCYVSNVDLAKGEITLTPAAEITLEGYNKALENEKYYTISETGEEFLIFYGEANNEEMERYIELGRAYLHTLPRSGHWFDIPTAEKQSSVIENYFERTPIKAVIDENTQIRYGVLGYDENGNPYDYESLGKNHVQTPLEFFGNYCNYTMNSHFKAHIKDGKLIYLDVLYMPYN